MIEDNCKIENADDEYGYSVDINARSRVEAEEMLKDIVAKCLVKIIKIREELAQEKRDVDFAHYLRTGKFEEVDNG